MQMLKALPRLTQGQWPGVTSFQVVNTGTDTLNVTDVYSDDPNLVVEESAIEGGENTPEAAFPLAPGAARLFNLRWQPVSPGSLNAHVHVTMDGGADPAAGLLDGTSRATIMDAARARSRTGKATRRATSSATSASRTRKPTMPTTAKVLARSRVFA